MSFFTVELAKKDKYEGVTIDSLGIIFSLVFL